MAGQIDPSRELQAKNSQVGIESISDVNSDTFEIFRGATFPKVDYSL